MRSIIRSLSACIILLGATGYTTLSQHDAALDEECKAYGDELLPAVLAQTPYNTEVLAMHVTPVVRGALVRRQVQVYDGLSERLGQLLGHQNVRTEVDLASDMLGYPSIACTYRAMGTFEHASAEILLQLVLQDAQWLVAGLAMARVVP